MMKKTIGILGGMGPESTALFYQAIIQQCQKQYGAKYDEDYPEIFIYNLPIPDVVETNKKSKKIIRLLVYGMKKLESLGVDGIFIPCNTVHSFFQDLKNKISTPLINIVKTVAEKAESKGYKKLGLIATTMTVKNKIYDKIFGKYGMKIIVPENKRKITSVILNILAGKKSKKDKKALLQIIQKLQKSGAEAVILGCTDVSILLQQQKLGIELLDSIEIYAESAVKFAISQN